MRKLLFIVLPILVLLALPLWVLNSEKQLIALAHWAVATFTDLRLELKHPVLTPLEGRVAASEIHLYPARGDGPPFLSVLGFEAALAPGDIYNGNLRRSTLSAAQATLYISDRDSTEDPEPIQWLEYLSWLPARLDVEQAHLVTAFRRTLVLPIGSIHGGRYQPGHFSVSATADYDNQPLALDIDLSALRHDSGQARVNLNAVIRSGNSGSEITLEGGLSGTEDAFDYRARLQGHFADVGLLARGIEGALPLDGRLGIEGTLNGDTRGFVLEDARLLLDNLPSYGIEAAGSLIFPFDGDDQLQLVASGEMTSMEHLLDWLSLDLAALGRARGSAVVSGSLSQPVIESFRLHSDSSSGLVVSVGGQLDTGRIAALGNAVQLDVYGPSLSVLEPWTGPLDYDPGEFVGRARLVGHDDGIAAEELLLEFGDGNETVFRIAGRAANVEGASENGLTAITGLELVASLLVADTATLGRYLKRPPPPGLSLVASLPLRGTGEKLVAAQGEILLQADQATLAVTGLGAEIQPAAAAPVTGTVASWELQVDDTAALSHLAGRDVPPLGRLSGSGDLRQQGELLQLHNSRLELSGGPLDASGQLQFNNLLRGDDLRLDLTLGTLDQGAVLRRWLDTGDYRGELGTAGGQLQAIYRRGRLDIRRLALASTDRDGALDMALEGSVEDLGGTPDLRLKGSLRVRDGELLHAITGLRMSPLEATATAAGRGGNIDTRLRGRMGETELSADGNLLAGNNTLEQLTLHISSPHLRLSDVGLQAEVAASNYQPAAQIEEAVGGERLEQLLAHSPRFPSDITLELMRISGDNTNIDSFRAHITGRDNRYTLQDFSIGYDQATAVLRGIIDLNARPPFVSIAGEALALPIGTLGRDVGIQSDVRGVITLRGGLSAQGLSAQALLADVDGSLAVALEDAEFEGAAYDLLATDLLAWLMTAAATRKTTRIDCTMGQFLLRDGVATSDDLLIETRQMVATGKARLDLVNSLMDVSITPRSKTRTLQVPSSVRLKGAFDDPTTTVSPVAAAFDAYAELLATVPRLTMKLFGIRRNERQAQPCG